MLKSRPVSEYLISHASAVLKWLNFFCHGRKLFNNTECHGAGYQPVQVDRKHRQIGSFGGDEVRLPLNLRTKEREREMEPRIDEERKSEGEFKCVPVQSLPVKTAFWPRGGGGGRLGLSVSLACHSDS